MTLDQRILRPNPSGARVPNTITRRAILRTACSWFAAGAAAVRIQPARAAPAFVLAYIGTYTPNAEGIYLYRVSLGSGTLTRMGVTGEIKNPSWLALHPNKHFLYAVSEVDDSDGVKTGSVSAYAIAADSGALKPLNTVRTQGASPTYVSVHPSGRYVFAANYTGGSVTVLPAGSDGRLSEPTDVVAGYGPLHAATAVDDPPGNFGPSDHSGSHMHMVACDPSGRFVIANDAGLDRTYVWRIDLERGKLLPAKVPVVDAPAGSAPRHFAFHPNGLVMYNLSEQDSMLAVFDFDPASGELILKQRQSVLPTGFMGSNLASEVAVSADGRFVYAANRLHDTIAIFAAAADGRLASMGEQWTYADYPRSIAIDPTGRFVFSCNQRSDSITTFARDPLTGHLTFTGQYEPIGTPVNMTFLT